MLRCKGWLNRYDRTWHENGKESFYEWSWCTHTKKKKKKKNISNVLSAYVGTCKQHHQPVGSARVKMAAWRARQRIYLLAQPLTGRKKKKRKDPRDALRFRGTAFLARLHTPSSSLRGTETATFRSVVSLPPTDTPAKLRGGGRGRGDGQHTRRSQIETHSPARVHCTYVRYKDTGTLVSRSHTCSRFMRAPHAPHNSTDGKLLNRPFASCDSQPAVLFFFFFFLRLARAIFRREYVGARQVKMEIYVALDSWFFTSHRRAIWKCPLLTMSFLRCIASTIHFLNNENCMSQGWILGWEPRADF